MSKVEELIARVRELDAKATPGPWAAGGYGPRPDDGPDRFRVRQSAPPRDFVADVGGWNRQSESDADAIARYRTVAPLLAAMLRKAMAALGAAEVDALQGLPWDSSAYLRVFREIEAIAEGSEA